MQRKHVAQQAQRERNCSPTNGTGHRASARIARVGVSALGFAGVQQQAPLQQDAAIANEARTVAARVGKLFLTEWEPAKRATNEWRVIGAIKKQDGRVFFRPALLLS